MKKLLLGITLSFGTFFLKAQDLPAYQRFIFTDDAAAYTQLSDEATPVSFLPEEFEEEGIAWDDPYSDPIDMPFPFTYQNVEIENFTIDGYGALIFNEIYNEAEFQTAGLFMDYVGLEERGNVYYEVTGSEGDRILKVEFRDVSSYNNYTGDDTFNFQIWLYETSNVIEYHAGYSNVPGEYFVNSIEDLMGEEPKEFIFSAVFTNEGDFLTESGEDLYMHYVRQEEEMYSDSLAAFLTVSGESDMDAFLDVLLGHYPDEGTVFRFTPVDVPSGIVKIPSASVKIYPNPASDHLNLEITDAQLSLSAYDIYDVYGKKVLSGQINSRNTAVSLSGLGSGQYIIKVGNSSAEGIYKFIKL